eukprot:261765-Chlamydomonas_euryale.AAC.1
MPCVRLPVARHSDASCAPAALAALARPSVTPARLRSRAARTARLNSATRGWLRYARTDAESC